MITGLAIATSWGVDQSTHDAQAPEPVTHNVTIHDEMTAEEAVEYINNTRTLIDENRIK